MGCRYGGLHDTISMIDRVLVTDTRDDFAFADGYRKCNTEDD